MTHAELFDSVPVGRTVSQRWERQDSAALDAAAAKIAAHGGNPWVFAADERHFEQFSRAADQAALLAMEPAERAALLAF